MRLAIACGAVMASMAAATPPREARRVTVLVEHDADEDRVQHELVRCADGRDCARIGPGEVERVVRADQVVEDQEVVTDRHGEARA